MNGRFASEDGDAISLTANFGKAVAASELQSPGDGIAECGVFTDRSLAVPVVVEFEVTSSLPVDVELTVFEPGALIAYGDGPQCGDGVDGVSFEEAEPGSTHTLRFWVPIVDAITPKDPTGSAHSVQGGIPSVTLQGVAPSTEEVWGPRVVDCSQITGWVAGPVPQDPNYLSGTSSPCEVVSEPR